ncbi:MAG: Hemolysins family protein containing CBS domain [Candidatus Methanohalarchaeum thermophilum]|uniref:Hemolysins family protein containing CBS domain n=1 Tax=Methanohalarchaeum thermophilum TaxID=1903181 RepID=A0A1Q6DWA0_METT1|nr:MAG: Hemolysins family protein containing CBS domain [Candidatus Methanohalarchaeum thermophilum]
MLIYEIVFRLLAGVFLILANGFFVAIEFGLTRARQYSKEVFEKPGLKLAWKMTEELEIYLTTCQVGITATSIALGIVAEPALAVILEPFFAGTFLASIGLGSILAFLVLNLFHLTHGEQTPTYLGVEKSLFVCRYFSKPLYYFNKIVYPLIWIGDSVAKKTLALFGVEMSGEWLKTNEEVIESRADLRNELNKILKKGDLTKERRSEIMKALEIGNQKIKNIMVPREDIKFLSTENSLQENIEVIKRNPHTRYPLVKDDLDSYLGVIYSPDIIEEVKGKKNLDLTKYAEEALCLSPDTTVSKAIDLFQEKKQELGLIKEEDNIKGLITITDTVEEILGEFEDPMKRPKS